MTFRSIAWLAPALLGVLHQPALAQEPPCDEVRDEITITGGRGATVKDVAHKASGNCASRSVALDLIGVPVRQVTVVAQKGQRTYGADHDVVRALPKTASHTVQLRCLEKNRPGLRATIYSVVPTNCRVIIQQTYLSFDGQGALLRVQSGQVASPAIFRAALVHAERTNSRQ